MRRRSFLVALAALALVATGLSVVPTDQPARAATPVRIMPLGDSITGSPGCWRALLWNRLQSTGFTNIDFVGTLGPQGCGVTYDGDNEGHGGILATNIASGNQLPPWLSATRPDIILMHLGTNDVWNNRSPQQILDAFSTMLTQMRASNPNVRLVIAKILPMNPSNCAECGQRVVNLNNAIGGWVSANSTAQSPITVVDQWTGFSTSADTSDGVHPNNSGTQKMSDKWYPAVVAALNGVAPSNPPLPSSSSRSSGPPPNRGCTATYTPINAWPGQYQANIVIRNSATTTTTRWSTTLELGTTTLQQLWGGIRSTTTGTVTIINEAYNGTLNAGQSTTAGFIINGSPPASAPVLSCSSS